MAEIPDKQKKSKKKSDSFKLDKNAQKVEAVSSMEKVTEVENDYIILINKKIRSLNKKLRTAEEIEKKVAGGAKINYDQQQILANKNALAGGVKELEHMRGKLLKVHFEEEKQEKRWKTRAAKIRERTEIGPLVNLFHLVNLVAEGSPIRQRLLGDRSLGLSEADFATFAALATVINTKQPNTHSEISCDHARKYMAQSEEQFKPGVTYKTLKQKVLAITGSAAWNELQGPPPVLNVQQDEAQDSQQKETASPIPTQTKATEAPKEAEATPASTQQQPTSTTEATSTSSASAGQQATTATPTEPSATTTTATESTQGSQELAEQQGGEEQGGGEDGEQDEGDASASAGSDAQGQQGGATGDDGFKNQPRRGYRTGSFRGRGNRGGGRGGGRGRFTNSPRGGSPGGGGSFRGSPRNYGNRERGGGPQQSQPQQQQQQTQQ